MGQLIYLKNVTSLTLDEKKCVGCGMCMTVCPHAVFCMNETRARIIHRNACMECGACAKNCLADAIYVKTGVGCAAAVINSFLGRTDASCCCVIEPEKQKTVCR
jgi:NAD-dependent dihydropyrimidine dehydrogenase PreA subunit